MKLEVPENYPLVPPKATFLTKVFHPNVHFKARAPPHPSHRPSIHIQPDAACDRRAGNGPCAAPPLPCARHRQAVYSLSGFLKTRKPLLSHKPPVSTCR